jgi:hypothetical protein
VIEAADAAFLVAAEEQRGAAMRAAMVHHADAAGTVAERNQLLAQHHEAHRRPVALQLGRFQGRQPVLPHQLAHGGAWPDAGEFDALAGCGHVLPYAFPGAR